MFVKFINLLNNVSYPKYTKKVKKLILKYAYNKQVKDGCKNHYYEPGSLGKKIEPYEKYSRSIVDQAINQLEREGKITINKNNSSPNTFSLTENTFQNLSNNLHPIKTWIYLHSFDLFNLVVAIVLAIFF